MATPKEDFFTERLEEIARKCEALTEQLCDPEIYSRPAEQVRLSKERSEYEEIVHQYASYKALLQQIAEAHAICFDASADEELRALAESEESDLQNRREPLERLLKNLLLSRNIEKDRNLFLEIRAGTGGGEAALFSSDLLRMYTKYAEGQGWKVELVSISETGIGGIKDATLSIVGKGAYHCLQYESGVHRVQRVPETEASGRIHTSTVTVAVIPEAEEVDIQIDAKDIRTDTYCASSAGGQSVNTTYSAVRLTHLPTGVVVTCQDERSQLKNRNKAMRVLRSRIFEIEQEKRKAEIEKNRKSQIGTGDRSEKIRTYNFRENRVTDHRINLSVYQLPQILEGALDPFIDGLLAYGEQEALKEGING